MKSWILRTLPGFLGVTIAILVFQLLPHNDLRVSEFSRVNRKPALLPFETPEEKSESSEAEKDAESLAVRLAHSSFDENGKLTCAYASLITSYFDEMPDQEVIQSLQNEITAYENFIASTEKTSSARTKKIQRRTLRDLRILTQHPNPREKLRQALELPCRAGVSLGGTLVRLTGLSGTLLTTAITTPVRFIAKMGIGAYTRKATPERGPSYPEFMGAAGGITQVTGLVQQTIRFAFGAGNPWLLARTLVFAIDLEAADVCSRINPKHEREVRFCQRYKLIKDNEFKVTEAGEKIGIKLGNQLLHTFDFRSDERENRKICEASVKKQYRVARRAVERLEDDLKVWGVKPVEVKIIAPEIQGCISLQVITENESDETKVILEGTGMVDGLLYSVVTKENLKDIPKEPKPDPVTDEEICQAIHSTQVVFAVNKERLATEKMTLMQSVLNPKRFAYMGTEAVLMPPQMVYREPLEEIANKRALIMILAPTEAQREEYRKISEEFGELQKRFKNRRKKLSRLVKSKNYEACLEKQAEIGFDFQEFKDISNSLSSMQVSNRITEFEKFLKETRQAGRKLYLFKHLRLPWEVVEFSNLNEIRKALASPDVAHVIFVSHGESNGKIIDPRLNSLPASVFEWLAPSIQSVSFFACHTRDAIVSYRLKEHLAAQPTVHPIRYAGFVNTAGLFDEKNQAPHLALSRFIEDLDKEMSIAQEGSRRAQSLARQTLVDRPENPLCQVQINGTTVLKGAFAVKINSKWAGVLYPESTDEQSRFSFPCAWIKPDSNRVFLENISLTEKSSIEIGDVFATVESRGGSIKVIPTPENIRRRKEDQSISALLFTW